MKKKWIVLGLVIVASSGGYWYYTSTKTTTQTFSPLVRVATGSLRSVIKATGNITPMQQSTLSFVKQGTLKKLYKKVGDTIKAGDLIAEVDAGSAGLDLQSAQLALSNAKLSYDKLFSTTTESDILKSKNTLTEAESALKLLEAKYRDLLIQQKNDLAESEANVNLLTQKQSLAQSEYEYAKQNIASTTTANNLEHDLESARITLEDIERTMPDIRKTLYDTMLLADKSNSRYGDLGVNDDTNKRLAESTFMTMSGQLTAFQNTLKTLRSLSTKNFDSTLAALEDAQSLMSITSKLMSYVLTELETTRVGGNYSTNDIDDFKTTIKTNATTVASKASSVSSSLSALKNYGSEALQALSDKNTLASKEQALTSAKNDLVKAKRAYETLKQSQETARATSQDEMTRQKNTVDLSRLAYNELVAGPKSNEIRTAQNSIASAELSLQKVNIAMKDYQIHATFDGEIQDIPWIVGDTTISTEGILISNKNAYEISLSLDQIDIVKVQAGMKASIILDAFPTETFTGVVSSISATPTVTSGVVSYTAKIMLTLPKKEILSQMSATVTVILAEKNNILLIPSSVTTSENGKTYVQIQKGIGSNASTEKREVTLGLSENGKVEVLSGLSLGESVRSNSSTPAKKTTTSSSNGTSSSRSSSSMNGGMSGPPPGGF